MNDSQVCAFMWGLMSELIGVLMGTSVPDQEPGLGECCDKKRKKQADQWTPDG